jgi:divalent metal cation (Fe/Co/Zn/Cd) transporter
VCREVWSAPLDAAVMTNSLVPSRASLLVSALRLSYFTIAWSGVVGTGALVVAFATASLALAGFALNALLDSSASVVLVWRFTREQRDPVAAERVERHAQGLIAGAMLAIATYVGVQATRALLAGSHPTTSASGVALAIVSLVVLPFLGTRKLQVASRLRSPALRGDAVLTIAAAALAAITLGAMLANSALGWWWADPLAALVIAAVLAVEGVRVLVRHRFG